MLLSLPVGSWLHICVWAAVRTDLCLRPFLCASSCVQYALSCPTVSPALPCRYSAGATANILWSAGVKDKGEVGQVIARLEAAGMPTLDISNMDAARVRGLCVCGDFGAGEA